MAFLLPTIATKRTNRSVARNLAGASAIFIARTRSTSLARDYSAAGGRIPTSWAHRRGALGARRRCRAEGEQRLVRLHAQGIKPQPRPRGIVGGEAAGRDRYLVDI